MYDVILGTGFLMEKLRQILNVWKQNYGTMYFLIVLVRNKGTMYFLILLVTSYSSGLSTATIEYSCASVCLCVCLSVYTITQKIMVQSI